jgi:hypothetical protein
MPMEPSLTIAKSRGRPVDRPPGRCQLDPGGREQPHLPVVRMQAHTDELAVHLHLLDATVWLQQRAQLRLVDPRHEEVLVGVRDAEQLVPHGAADDVRVQPERADVVTDRGGTGALCRCGHRQGEVGLPAAQRLRSPR